MTYSNLSNISSILVYWDYQNAYNKKYVNLLLICLVEYAKQKGLQMTIKAFDNWDKKPKDKQKLNCSQIEFIQVSQTHRNAVDEQILIEFGGDIKTKKFDIVIVITGDHFAYSIINKVKEFGKRIIIISDQGKEAQKLKSMADEFYYTDEFINKFSAKQEQKTQQQKLMKCLNYREAVYYLIKAIKTCLEKGLPANSSRICNFMANLLDTTNLMKNCPILQPDGIKTFQKFNQFIEVVIQDGIIIQREQQLYLI